MVCIYICVKVYVAKCFLKSESVMEHNFAADMEIFVYTEILNQILTVTIQVS